MEKQSTRKFLKLLIALVALFLLAASALMLASCKEHVHQYELDQDKSTNATCSQAGSQTFVCPECGDIYVNVVPATGQHTWQETKVYPASCESEGWTVFTCSVCGTQKQDNWTPKLTHKYEVAETHEATCTTDGYQIFECSFCGDRYTDSQYTAEHPKLGHDWGTNTDTEDTATSAADKLEGWYTVSAADCLNAQVLERKCSRCGETEKKVGTAALGHLWGKTTVDAKTKNQCAINDDLIDAEGNAVYAYECGRENCPVEVVINNRGDVAHYIKAVDHKLKTVAEYPICDEDQRDEVVSAETGYKTGYKYEVCENCDTYSDKAKETKLEVTGHKWNTKTVDGKNDVVVCEKDKDLADRQDYLDYIRSVIGNSAFLQNQQKYVDAYAAAAAAWEKAGREGDPEISRVCSVCGEATLALGHEYIIAKYVEGSSSEYEVDENGLPVDYSDEVTVATMDCRYVQVCKNGCGEILARGQHKDVSTATCRQGGVCSVCGVQQTSRLAHTYIDVASIIENKAAAGELKIGEATVKYGDKNVTWKQAYDAYTKVSATETWMTPLEGDCDEKSTTVHICLVCLLDAAKADSDVAWTQGTLAAGVTVPTDDGKAQSLANAYVVTNNFGHKYEVAYFNLAGVQVDKEDTSCQVGFYTKWICSKCEAVYTNVPVADNTDTKEDVESKNNNAGDKGFTNADGFVLTLTNDSYDYDAAGKFTAKELEKALGDRDNHYGEHILTVANNYWQANGYVAPTCVSAAIVPFYCEKCGYTTTGAADADETDFTGVEDVDTSKVRTPDGDPNPNNHAGEAYACGMHCDYHNLVTGKYCGAIKNDMTDAKDHAAVTISYQLVQEQIDYYTKGNYTLQIARVGSEPISDKAELKSDLTNYIVTLLDGTKISPCMGSMSGNMEFVEPSTIQGSGFTAPTGDNTADYLVLVSTKDNTVYPIKGDVTFYSEATGAGNTSIVNSGTVVKQDDTYFVKFADIGSGTTDAPVFVFNTDSLEAALAAKPEKVVSGTTTKTVLTVNFSADVKDVDLAGLISTNVSTAVSEIVFNLNGKTLDLITTIEAGKKDDEKAGAYTFNDGTITSSVEGQAFTARTSPLTFNGVTLHYTPETADNAAAILENELGTLTLTDSKIVTTAQYGIKTLDTVYGKEYGKIAITNSTIIMNPNNDNLALVTGTAVDNVNNVALYVAVPVTVTVKDSTLSANRQVAVVRGGNVTFTGSTLTLVDGYESPDKDYTTPGNMATVPGYSSLEDYLLAGYWYDGGNNVVSAALVVGNSNDRTGSTFKSTVTVILSDTTVNVADGATKAYIASRYAQDVLKANGYAAATDTSAEKIPTMVYFNAGSCIEDTQINVGYGWTVGTINLVNCGDLSGKM